MMLVLRLVNVSWSREGSVNADVQFAVNELVAKVAMMSNQQDDNVVLAYRQAIGKLSRLRSQGAESLWTVVSVYYLAG